MEIYRLLNLLYNNQVSWVSAGSRAEARTAYTLLGVVIYSSIQKSTPQILLQGT